MIKPRSNTIKAILRRRSGFILGLTILGAGTTALSLSALPPLYTAKAQILFPNADQKSLNTHAESLHSIFSAGEKNHGLKIHTPPQTSVLNLEYTDENAERAARIVNALSKSYIARQIAAPHTPENKNTQKFLNQLKANIEKSEKALKKFEKRATKYARAPSIKAHQEYETAKTNLRKAQNDITPFLKKDGNFELNPNAPALRNASSLEKLREKQRELKQNHTALSTRYGAKHPKMRELAASLMLVDKQITDESQAILETLKTNYALAKTHIKTLEEEGMRNALEQEAARYKQSQEKLDLLKTRLKEAQNLHATFKDVQAQANIQTGQKATLLTPASPPTSKSFPNIPRLSAIAAIISALIASFIAIFQERRSNGFTSAGQIEEAENLQCYALIQKAAPDKNKPIADFVLDNPSHPVAEAVRTLLLNIKLHKESTEDECKVISLTSSLTGEGKTTVASWIAHLSAKSGKRTILIDADIRRPSVHLALGKRNKASLADYLSGTKKREETIDTSDKSGLHVIYGRAVPTGALDMISSEKMDNLIRSLRTTYDLIIIDTPASMAVPDARALERRSDLFLYCIAWNRTSRTLIHNGIAQFRKFSNPSIATVLTQIDPKKHVQLGYGITENEYEDYKLL